jgi:Mrp family chromosome partitioning ATPase
MSRIYEALRQAERERAEAGKLSSLPLREVDPMPAGPEVDRQIYTIYNNISATIAQSERKVIQFIGSREGEGTSTLVNLFARISAEMTGRRVLLLDAGLTSGCPPVMWKAGTSESP